MIKELQQLLYKVDIIRLRQQLKPSSDRFNIFSILRQESDEVNLHSRFLHELLNPKGSHGLGHTFLNHFAKICENFPVMNDEHVQVLREHANIDILIQDNQHAVVIENKIYAGDQHEQLKRYHEYTTKAYRKPTLFYLTLDGKEPSGWSTAGLEAPVHLISYAGEIDQWLTACIKESAAVPSVRETLIQYQNLVHRLTGNDMNELEKTDVLSLMAQDENAERAMIIARNWNHVRWHTEWEFWNEFLAVVEHSYHVSPGRRFSAAEIDKVVHGRNGKSPWYGLSFLIGKLSGTDVHLRIERNEGPMYYGLPYCSSDAGVRSRMLNAIQHLVTQQTKSWAGLKLTDCGINFKGFSNAVTLQLANPEKRKKIIGELWSEIQIFVRDASASLQQEFGGDFVSIPSSTEGQ